MTEFSWMYTQFSQFNKSDTLLLVSGVHFGARMNVSGSGEIAVFSLLESNSEIFFHSLLHHLFKIYFPYCDRRVRTIETFCWRNGLQGLSGGLKDQLTEVEEKKTCMRYWNFNLFGRINNNVFVIQRSVCFSRARDKRDKPIYWSRSFSGIVILEFNTHMNGTPSWLKN